MGAIGMIRMTRILTLIFLAAVLAVPSLAQEKDYTLGLGDEDWRFDLYGYIWAIGIAGTLGMGDQNVDLAIDINEILKKIDFGAFLFFQARKDHLGIMTDIMYANLGDEGTITNPLPNGDPLDLKLDMKLLMWDIAGAWGAGNTARWDFLVGGKFVNVSPKMEIVSLNTFDQSLSWFDPYLGVRFGVNEGRWYGNVRFDGGGFGIGSDLYWQFLTGAGYQFARKWSTNVMYRVTSFDYKDEEKSFVFDAQISGWQVGIGYHF
jgi:opacity protein-like surface antigen